MNIQEILDNAKETLGLQAQEIEAGVYIPSKSSLKLAAPSKTNYDNTEYDTPYTGNKKILILKFKGEKKKSTPAQPQTTNHNCHTHQTKKMGERQEFINFAKRCSLEQIRLCFQAVDIHNKQQEEQQII